MTLPNFLVVGVARSGSTALVRFLRQHPDVFVPWHKETSHFLFESGPPRFSGPGDDYLAGMVRAERAAYERLFDGVRGEQAVGEGSVYYFHRPECFPRIDRALPGARLIAVLRDPVERAFSAFGHMTREGRETETDFRRALELEPARVAAGWEWGWEYAGASRYAERVERLWDTFGRERVLLLRHDELAARPAAVLATTFGFLGVDPGADIDTSERVNPSGRPRSRHLQHLVTRPHPVKDALRPLVPDPVRQRVHRFVTDHNVAPMRLDPGLRAELAGRFDDDVRRLEALTGWDLGAWRARQPVP